MRALPAYAAGLLLALSTAPSPASAGDVRASGKLISGAATGPPIEVASSERVEGLNADRLDGFDAADFAATGHGHAGVPYANVIVVSPSGGDFTSIQAAIDSVTDASAVNPYLIWIGPGVYEEPVTTKDGIDLHGAGRDLVVIRSPLPGSTGSLVTLGGNGEVRSLTVDSSITVADGALTALRGIQMSGDSPRLVDVEVRTTVVCGDPDIDFSSTGIQANSGASPTLERVTVEARVTGSQASGLCHARAFLVGQGGMPVLDDVSLVAEGTDVEPGTSIAIALNAEGSLPLVRDSVLVATGADFANRAFQVLTVSGQTSGVRAAHSQVIGAVFGSNVVCVGAYDGDFVVLGAGCI